MSNVNWAATNMLSSILKISIVLIEHIESVLIDRRHSLHNQVKDHEGI